MDTLQPLDSLNKHQLEILQLFSRQMEEKDLIEIKRLIVSYLSKNVTEMADKLWEENGWKDEDMERMLMTHQRTKYNPEN